MNDPGDGYTNIDVAAALIKQGNLVLICQRSKSDSFGLMWEFPGGKIESAEAPREAVTREIKEELGVLVKPTRFIREFTDRIGAFQITVHLFECTYLEGKYERLECNDFMFVSIRSLRDYRLAPVDIKIAEYLAQRYIEKPY